MLAAPQGGQGVSMNIAVRQCMIGETEWFRKLEGEYHYMGGGALDR